MKDDFLSRATRLDQPGASRLFAKRESRRVIALFASRPTSLGEVVASSGMSMARLHYLAGRLVAEGLLEVVEERPRKGRAVKLYRPTSEVFFLPDAQTVRGFGYDMNSMLRDRLEELGMHEDRGTLYRFIEGEGFAERVTPNSEEVIELWFEMAVARGDLAALKSELIEVITRFEARSPEARKYVLHAAAAPL